MNLTPEELQTIDWYNQNASVWSDKHCFNNPNPPMFAPEFTKFIQLVPSGKILEIGAGSGLEAKQFIKNYGAENYIGVDASSGLLKIAKKTNPDGNFKLMNLYSLAFPDSYFDGLWICATIIHVPYERLSLALNEAYRVLKAHGYGFISIMEGNENMVNSRPGRYYSLWPKKAFIKEVNKAGFKIHSERTIHTNASPWLALIVKK